MALRDWLRAWLGIPAPCNVSAELAPVHVRITSTWEEVKALRMAVTNALARIDELEKANIARAIVEAGRKEVPAPRKAGSWRQAMNFMTEGETIDAPR